MDENGSVVRKGAFRKVNEPFFQNMEGRHLVQICVAKELDQKISTIGCTTDKEVNPRTFASAKITVNAEGETSVEQVLPKDNSLTGVLIGRSTLSKFSTIFNKESVNKKKVHQSYEAMVVQMEGVFLILYFSKGDGYPFSYLKGTRRFESGGKILDESIDFSIHHPVSNAVRKFVKVELTPDP